MAPWNVGPRLLGVNVGLEGPVLAEGSRSVGTKDGRAAVEFVDLNGAGVGVGLPSDSVWLGGVVDIYLGFDKPVVVL